MTATGITGIGAGEAHQISTESGTRPEKVSLPCDKVIPDIDLPVDLSRQSMAGPNNP